MLLIARNELMRGFKDAKFLLLSLLVLCAFGINGYVYSVRYDTQIEDYRRVLAENELLLNENMDNLQNLSNQLIKVMRPPSPLMFIRDGGDHLIPDSWSVNAFIYRDPVRESRSNRFLPIVGSLDWSFIIGTLMSLLAILISFDSISGEKQQGTLRLLLSNPLSRLSLFFGKFLGLIIVLSITMICGAFICLIIIVFIGHIPLSFSMVSEIAAVLILGLTCVVSFLLLSLTISSMVHNPAVGLVNLLILWMILGVAVPGITRLIGQKTVAVETESDIERNISSARAAISDSHPEEAHEIVNDPADKRVRFRKIMEMELLASEQQIRDNAIRNKIRQSETIDLLSWITPMGILSSSYEKLSGTGLTGYISLFENAGRYRDQLMDFTIERDRLDPDSPHQIYSFGTSTDHGVYSEKPVELSTVPRPQALYSSDTQSTSVRSPFLELLILLIINIQMGFLGIVAISRYDPR